MKIQIVSYTILSILLLCVFTYVLDHFDPVVYLSYILVSALLFIGLLIRADDEFNLNVQQLEFTKRTDSERLTHFVHHIFEPAILYISLCAFLYFNRFVEHKVIILFFSSYIFYMLYENIEAFNHNQYRLELKTHYVYDLISIFNFYILLDVISYLIYTNGFNLHLTVAANIMIFVMEYVFILIRYRLAANFKLFVFFLVIFVSLNVSCLLIPLNFLKTNLVVTMVIYFVLSAIHHRINLDFNRWRLLEYLVFLALFLIIIGRI
jgi:hypothetical protein